MSRDIRVPPGAIPFSSVGASSLSQLSRSAGACPPRSFGNPQHGEGQALALRYRVPFFFVARGPVPRDRWVIRGMARDRPSPYGIARRFFS